MSVSLPMDQRAHSTFQFHPFPWHISSCSSTFSVFSCFFTPGLFTTWSEKLLTSPPKVIWEEPSRQPSWQKMDSPTTCANCTMPTADKSNHSATGTLHPHHTDGNTTMAYMVLAVSCNKNTENSNLADIIWSKKQAVGPTTQVPQSNCKELHRHSSCKEWTRPLCVLLAAQCPMQTSPITQPRVQHFHKTTTQCQCHTALSLLTAKLLWHVIFLWNHCYGDVNLASGLQRRVRDFFMKSLLHFSKFLVNTTSIS